MSRGPFEAALLVGLLLTSVVPAIAEGATDASTSVPAPSAEDLKKERFFLEGEIAEIREIGSGVTKPKRALLRIGDETMYAAFKDVDVFVGGRTAFESGRQEVNFTDNYRYERAAYLLDRRLGLGMVPVAVIREVNGNQGALVEWVSDAFDEEERREKDLEPDPRYLLSYQKSLMHLFDALIYNIDRNLGNQLYTRADWKLHLIDHTRAFRSDRALPPEFQAAPIRLPRSLLPRLESLNQDELKQMFKGLVPNAQIKALLKRRDAILKKIEKDLEKYGEVMVFVLEPDGEAAAPAATD
jgi:hypothetical protein